MGRGSAPEVDMSNQVTPPYGVSSAYEDFIREFQTAVESANQELQIPDRPLRSCFDDSGPNSGAAFKACLYLKGWPCRRLARGKRLDIAIKALETFARPSWQLTKSTVYLNYFVVSGSSATLVQSLHFDFLDGGQLDHPFFHVQLSDEVIPSDDLRSAGFELNLVTPQETSQCWVTTRIPTPEMTLASVLYCLVADHLGAGIFQQFAENVLTIQSRLPTPGFEALRNSLRAPLAHFKSSHWFAHMGNRAGQNN
jgi:hypothetical protein